MVFVSLRALPILTYPPGRDQGTFLTIGQGLLEGKLLYRDLWDNKPPGIFVIYAVIAKVFGRVMWSVALVDALWLFAISYCIFRYAEPYIGKAGAALAVAFHASWHAQAGYMFTAQPETFQVLLVFLCYFLVARKGRRRKAALAASGLLFGAACWLKYNVVTFLPFLLLVPYLDTRGLDRDPRGLALAIPRRSWLAEVTTFLAGLGAASVLGSGYFWLAGAWPAMRETQFEVMPRYAAMAVGSQRHFWLYAAAVTNVWLGPWTELATAAALLVAWWSRSLARFAPLVLAAAMAYASTTSQLTFRNYYFTTCYPFFAVVWGYLGVKIFEGCRAVARGCARRGWRSAAVGVWIVFGNLAYWPLPAEIGKLTVEYRFLREWWRDRDNFYADYPWQQSFEHLRGQLSVVGNLKANSAPGDGVYVWSADALIYFLADRRPPTRFVSNLGLMSAWAPARWRDELMRDLSNCPPRFVVVARKDWVPTVTYQERDSEQYLRIFPKLNEFIRGRYQLMADLNTFLIYRRAQ